MTATTTRAFRDVALVHTKVSDGGPLVVTFTPLQNENFDPPIGFGQDFLTKSGIDSLCFVSRWDHWWQTDDMDEAVTLAHAICQSYEDVVTYGTSMGGYAALAFSGALDAKRILAFSPQFSIDRAKVPFETRWSSHARKLTFSRDDLNGSLSKKADIILVYDPRSPDRLHIDLIEAPSAYHFKVPNVGHGVLGYLAQARILQGFVRDVANGVHDVSVTNRAALKSRRNFASYWITLADKAIDRKRYGLALKLLHRANEFGESFSITAKIARTLQIDQQFEEAGSWFAKAKTLRPDDRRLGGLAARCYMTAGMLEYKKAAFDRAQELFLRAQEFDPDDTRLDRLYENAFLKARAKAVEPVVLDSVNKGADLPISQSLDGKAGPQPDFRVTETEIEHHISPALSVWDRLRKLSFYRL